MQDIIGFWNGRERIELSYESSLGSLSLEQALKNSIEEVQHGISE